MTTHVVNIIETDSGRIVKTLQASSERQADKLDRGANINLNHECFHTEIVELTEEQAARMTSPFKDARGIGIIENDQVRGSGRSGQGAA